MDDDIEVLKQELEAEILFLRNLFRSTVQSDDTADARHEIASRILIASTMLNDLVCRPVEA